MRDSPPREEQRRQPALLTCECFPVSMLTAAPGAGIIPSKEGGLAPLFECGVEPMKLHAEIAGNKHEIEIKREDGKVFASVDGRHYELEASEPELNVLLFKHEGKVYEATVSPPKAGREVTHVRIGTDEFDIRVVDPKRLRGTSSEHEHGDGLAEIKTAMPGKVVSILCAVGDEVKKGDGILVVEAMKMQNELKAPKDGVVKQIRAEEGATVAAGDILATIE